MFGKLFKGLAGAAAGMAGGAAKTGMAPGGAGSGGGGGLSGIGARMRERAASRPPAPKSPRPARGFGRSLGSRR